MPSPPGKTYSKMFCQLAVLCSFGNGVWRNATLTSPLFLSGEALYSFNAHIQLSLRGCNHELKCTDVCFRVFESVVSGRGRAP